MRLSEFVLLNESQSQTCLRALVACSVCVCVVSVHVCHEFHIQLCISTSVLTLCVAE